MGTLYKEVVEYKRLKFVKFVLLFCSVIIVLNTVFLFAGIRHNTEERIYLSLCIFPFVASAMIFLWWKCGRRYKYTIIDRELIIEMLQGNRRRHVFSVNAKHIVSLQRVTCRTKKSSVEKEYNFSCSKKLCSYFCTFEKDNKLYGFYFQPSQEMINKINIICNRQIV